MCDVLFSLVLVIYCCIRCCRLSNQMTWNDGRYGSHCFVEVADTVLALLCFKVFIRNRTCLHPFSALGSSVTGT